MLLPQHVKVFAVSTFAILVMLQFIMPSLVPVAFDRDTELIKQQQQQLNEEEETSDKKFIHWERITAGRFNNQFLSHLMLIELAKGLGRSIIPPSFDINSDDFNSTTIVPFTSLFSVKPKITHNTHQQLQQKDETEDASSSTLAVRDVEQQIHAIEEMGKPAPYHEVNLRHAHHSSDASHLRMKANEVWSYARDRWTVCIATQCRELVRNIQMFEWAEPIASLIKSFIEQQDENGHQDTVGQSLGVHLRGGDWEHFCNKKREDPRLFAYSCHQESFQEIVANIEAVRRPGQKIFLATNYKAGHPLVQALREHYGDLLYRIPKLPKEYVKWTPFVEMGVLSRTERALLNRYSTYSGVVSVMMHFRNIHFFKHYSPLFNMFHLHIYTVLTISVTLLTALASLAMSRWKSPGRKQLWLKRIVNLILLSSVLWHIFAFLMIYSHLMPFKPIYAFVQIFYVIYHNLVESCMVLVGCLVTATVFVFTLSFRKRKRRRLPQTIITRI
eukprot:gb/GECH01012227.1/.p1 GENE.gb/GECH01012227.1/~~gb/GECH01012227.1/.p1  ORF type:complete len:500 (+),score=83.29 gb/GECH01012227.1/:1-1500(+)